LKPGTSQKKISANRANARFSTGPKSSAGKSHSRLNATKHGAYAIEILLWGEDQELYAAVSAEQQKKYQPNNFIDRALVDQLVTELWTLRRLTRAEYLLAQGIQEDLSVSEPADLTPGERKLLELMKDSPQETSERFAKATLGKEAPDQSQSKSDAVSDEKTHKQQRIYARLMTKAARIDKVYADMFLFSSQDRMQKLTWLRRQSLQTVLSIERELERRFNSET